MNKQCPRCGACYNGRRWMPKQESMAAGTSLTMGCAKELCPGCMRVERKQIEGIVFLKGDFFTAHREEIWNVLNRVARMKEQRNVSSRILNVANENGGVVIETTDEHLAESMGKELHKAFKGNLEMKWQEGAALVRVFWERDK